MNVKKRDADVVIVGLGCVGGIFARELSEAGLKVIALERGPDIDSGQYSMDELKFPIRNKILWAPEDVLYSWRSNPYVPRERIIRGATGWGPGGDHLHWGANSWRFQRETFKAKTVFGQVENGAVIDWPISYNDLEPYYQRFEERIGVGGNHWKDPFHPPRQKPYPMPPTVPGFATRHFAEAAKSLGYKPFPVPAAINSRDYDGRFACGYCGFCQGFGCVVEAKNDVGLTEIRKARANPNFEFRTHSLVTSLEVDQSNGRVSGVNYLDACGNRRHLTGEIVIVAASWLQSIRLLLLSRSPRFPYGLGNNRGQVGRYHYHRSISSVIGLFDEPMNVFLGPTPRYAVNYFAENNFDHREYNADFIMGGNLTGAEPFGLAGKPIEFTGIPTPEGIPNWGPEYEKFVKETYTRYYTIRIYTTEPPQLTSTIDLDPRVTDSHNLPVPRITFDWHPQTESQFNFLRERAVEILRAAGAKRIWGGQLDNPSGTSHPGGGTRMGEDPDDSVVNRYCQVHGVPNLFVVSSSSMPISGAYNPTETVGALAYWVADFIKTETKRGTLI